MNSVARGLVGLVGLFNAAVGLGFLLAPARLAAAFAIQPLGAQGLATVRADFTAFFLVGGGFALAAAWRADPRPLVVPLALLAIAFAGRLLSLAVDGVPPTAIAPMIAEVAMIAILLSAQRSLG